MLQVLILRHRTVCLLVFYLPAIPFPPPPLPLAGNVAVVGLPVFLFDTLSSTPLTTSLAMWRLVVWLSYISLRYACVSPPSVALLARWWWVVDTRRFPGPNEQDFFLFFLSFGLFSAS